MRLENIYKPIKEEISSVELLLNNLLGKVKNKTILNISRYLLDSPGKRIRPALVILCANALGGKPSINKSQLAKIASAIELIHMASLVHDDIVDHSSLRHSKPTINSKWGVDTAITMGDYLYSVAFDLISSCSNLDILRCISSATKSMCEGEFLQVTERDNLDLLKERYIIIVKKKTAGLFAASCQSGVLMANPSRSLQKSLGAFGLNFGIAFQIVDDYLDVVSEEKVLGKTPGQDIAVGEVTLPLLNLIESVPNTERENIKNILSFKRNRTTLEKIRSGLSCNNIAAKTKQSALFYMNLAKKNIDRLSSSAYKECLLNLADFVIDKGFYDKRDFSVAQKI